jgi:hypothetical protein
MSLAVLADHMASKGRGPDSMLIHMSPREVQGLQALAENHGGSLTINPETGLPEAGFLDKLLPTIIGAGISYFSGGTIDPMTAAAMVGGVETARTGDIGRGIGAGFQAYSGATLTAGMAGTGADAMTTAGMGNYAETLAARGLEAGTPAYGEAASQLALESQKEALATPFADRLSTGYEAVKKAGPMQYLKANAMPLAGAFGPAILAGMSAKENMPKTTTGMISPYTFDPYSGSYTAAVPYPASPNRAAGGGLMGMAAGGIAGYGDGDDVPRQNGMAQGGMYDFAQRSEPVVRMARGGVAHFEGGGGVSEYDYAPGGGGDSNYSVREDGSIDYFANQFAPDVFAPVAAAPVAAAPVVAAPVVAAPVAAPAATSVVDTGGGLAALNNAATNTAATTPVATTPVATTPVAATSVVDTGGGLAALNTAATTAATTTPYYFQVNPDVATEYAKNNQGFSTPEAYAQAHYDKYGKKEGREFAPSAAVSFAKANNQDLVANTNQWIIDHPLATGDQIAKVIKDSGMTTGDAQRSLDALVASGKISAAARWNIMQGQGLASQAEGVNKWLNANPNATQAQIAAVMEAASMNDADAKRLYEHGFQIANNQTTAAEKYINTYPGVKAWLDSKQGKDYLKDHPEMDKADIAWTHYVRYGAKDGFTWPSGADTTKTTTTTTTGTGTNTPITYNTAGTNALGGLEGMLGLPPGVSGAGITTVNPNGTITTRPNIPGIPAGGFTGMTSLRDAYEQGGGSLGYTPYTPQTVEEFDTKYGSKLTGGSKQSYDFLTGKTKYSPTPYTPTGEVMKPYAESVLGIPTSSSKKMYLFDPATKQYKINPDYAIPTYDKDGKKSYNLTNADVKTFMNTKPSTDAFYTWATTNNLSPEQIAQASERPINEISKLFTGAKDLVGDDGKIDQTKVDEKATKDIETNWDEAAYLAANPSVAEELRTGKSASGQPVQYTSGYGHWLRYGKDQGWKPTVKKAAGGGLMSMARGGMAQQFNLGDYSDGGRLLRGPGDGVSDSIPASIGGKRPARLADGEFVVPARIVSELGNGSTEAGARKLYAMMDRIQSARRGTVGRGRVAKNSRAEKYLPA